MLAIIPFFFAQFPIFIIALQLCKTNLSPLYSPLYFLPLFFFLHPPSTTFLASSTTPLPTFPALISPLPPSPPTHTRHFHPGLFSLLCFLLTTFYFLKSNHIIARTSMSLHHKLKKKKNIQLGQINNTE